ncbi:MAG: hypothetical protein KCHDKBKB_01517 [Elusimicrobia bacterium]|nr:hypothetical protein [Elusimicrobiota bacterium]
MNAEINSTLLFGLAVLATLLSFALIYFSREKWIALNQQRLKLQDETRNQAHFLSQEVSFYESRKQVLAKRSEQRRLLSEAARGMGSLLDPTAIQSRLIEIAKLLFPSHLVQISYGQKPDAIDSYVVERRQPLLVPSEVMKGPPQLAVPILAQRSVVGVLRLGGDPRSKEIFTRDDLRLLEILANLASLAMDNCVLFHQVQQTALRDHLTGLLTNRAFQDQLEQSILEASRYNQPLSLVLVDVDHFKNINDTQGHQMGDLILQGLAHVLDRNVRDVDIIARYGGEEFALLLLHTPHREASLLAEQIRKDLEAQVFGGAGKNLSITASFGVATFPEDATSGQQLFRQADQRLYKAKSNGRNQVQA